MRLLGLRLRYSLRTLLIVMAILALFCTWLVVPTLTANRFLSAVETREYLVADNYFRNPDDRFLNQHSEERWAFQTSAELEPWTVGQLLHGKRRIVMHLHYFEFDQNANRTANIDVTPLGASGLELTPVTHGGRYIYDRREASRPRR
jgi:hypothetical protein